MMFRTELQVPAASIHLTHQDKVVTLGSCFADVIGSRLHQHKVDVLVNPFGTIFNPVSVGQLLQASCGQPYNFEPYLVQREGIWYAYHLHSSLFAPSKQALLAQINWHVAQTRQHLLQAKLLIITFGTAVVYRLKSTGEVVANCHKEPAKNFDRVLLSGDEMLAAFTTTYDLLTRLNPGITVLLTVSPVRHLKETLETNSVSKALLRVLCHQLTHRHPGVLYFPAYELMLDDLRDYRFYKEDMLHPTDVAETYIWQKFVQAYYTSDFQEFILAWDKMQRALAHRSFHPVSTAHQAFLKNTMQQLLQLASKYKVDISQELRQLQQQQV